MPFTPSHVIAVLPFHKISKNYVSMTGLIAGSVAPDFEFFLRVTLYGNISHTWLGAFVFDFPVAVFIAFVFHFIVKKAFIIHLPRPLYQRWGMYADLNWMDYLKEHKIAFLSSCIVGILTHFLWDNFTHEPGYISNFQFNLFLKEVVLFGKSIAIYDLLQLLSSILGLIVLLIAVWKSPVYDLVPRKSLSQRRKYYMLSFFLTVGIIFVRYFIGIPDEKPLGQFIVISMSAFMQSLILLGIYHLNISNN